MKVLGIDFGERRIGLALSDPEGRMALPWGVIERDTDRRAAYRIAALVREEGVQRLVLGEPHDLEGRPGATAERIRRFGGRLCRITKLPVRYVDEALTTIEASERLAAAGLDDPKHAERRDAVAAQIVLQEALDRQAETASFWAAPEACGEESEL